MPYDISVFMKKLKQAGEGTDRERVYLLNGLTEGVVKPPHTPQECRELLRIFDGYWNRTDHPDAPYVRLTSGGVSDGYVNWWTVLRYAAVTRFVAQSLIEKIDWHEKQRRNDLSPWVCEPPPDQLQKELDDYIASIRNNSCWIFGVPDGMTQFAGIMAANLEDDCKSAPLVKMPDKSMGWERDTVLPGEKVLVVEDVTTTRGSIERAMEAIREGNRKRAPETQVEFFPFVCCLTNRSGYETLSDGTTRIISLTMETFRTWSADEFAKEHPNARVLKAKEGNNWAELMKYCAPLG